MVSSRIVSVWTCLALLTGLGILAAQQGEAAEVTRYFKINGAIALWNWTTTGITKLGTDVTTTTLPAEMADPARLSVWDENGDLIALLRNYRPGEFGPLNDWADATSFGLVRYYLAGKASGSGDRPDWGEGLTVTEIGEPTHEPGFDTVGVNWFAQTGIVADLGAEAPLWWCNAQEDAINKDGESFEDVVAYTFDEAAIAADGTVDLWIAGIVTDDLAGYEAGTAGYGILEGAVHPYALQDEDGDGYYANQGNPIGWDCDDDPSDDPVQCETCTCRTAECAPCARCINPGALEFAGDGIDSNCNGGGHDVASLIVVSFGKESWFRSGFFNEMVLFFVPISALILLRILNRKKQVRRQVRE